MSEGSVTRDGAADDREMEPAVAAELLRLRGSIDNMDAALIHLLAERFKITQQVGQLKAEYGLPPADPAREAQQIARLRSLAERGQAGPGVRREVPRRSSWPRWSATTRRCRPRGAESRSLARRSRAAQSASGVPASGAGPRGPTAEQAAAEERALQRSVAVHAAAAEAGGLAHRVHPGHRRAVRPQHPAVQIGLQATEGLAGQDVQPDRDQRPARPGPTLARAVRIEVRCGGATRISRSPTNFRAAAVATTCGSLPSPVRTCRSRASISCPQRVGVDQVLADQLVHLRRQLGDRWPRSGSRRRARGRPAPRRGSGPDPPGQQPQVLAGQVGVLLRAGQGELRWPSSRRRARTRSSRNRWP